MGGQPAEAKDPKEVLEKIKQRIKILDKVVCGYGEDEEFKSQKEHAVKLLRSSAP